MLVIHPKDGRCRIVAKDEHSLFDYLAGRPDIIMVQGSPVFMRKVNEERKRREKDEDRQ